MGSSFRIVIVGGGVAGLSVAWALTHPEPERGVVPASEPGGAAPPGEAPRKGPVQVTLLEREGQLATHSSALNAAILRTLDPSGDLTALLERSASFLRRPPADFCDHALVDPCGLILTADGGRASEEMARWIAHTDPSSEVRELDADELRGRMPLFAPRSCGPEPFRAWLFPHEGRLDVAHLCDCFARGARAAGARILTGPEGHVTKLLVEDGVVRGVLAADGSRLEADVVVLAAGAWAGALGRAAGSRIQLHPVRRHLLVCGPDPSIDPAWPVLWRHGEAFYCRPESGGMLLCACDETPIHDPDTLERDPEVLELVAAKTADNLPALEDAGAAHWWCGLRTMTSDGEFVIRFDPDVPGLYWVAGLGGHGMSGGAEAGRMAARELLQHKSSAGRRPRPAGV